MTEVALGLVLITVIGVVALVRSLMILDVNVREGLLRVAAWAIAVPGSWLIVIGMFVWARGGLR